MMSILKNYQYQVEIKINSYSEFIVEKKKHNSNEPVPKRILAQWFRSGFLRRIPVKAAQEILSWDYTYKSPISLSFYSKKKDWNHTEEGTIRISDHWNFTARGTIHCKTKQDGITQDQWAKGIYDKKDGKFDIVEYYQVSKKEEIDEFKSKFTNDTKQNFLDNGGQSVIDFGKDFTNGIKNGAVIFKNDQIETTLVKWKMSGMNPSLTILVNGTEVKLSDPKDFTISFDDHTYTRGEIFSKLGIHK